MSTEIDAPADDITLPALKPCPFCGAPGHLSTVTGWSSVGCSGFQSCPAYLRAQVHTTPEAAVAVWNNRPAILADRAVQMGTADHNAREMIARFRKAVFEAGAGDDSPENFGEVIDAQTALFAALAPPSPVPAAVDVGAAQAETAQAAPVGCQCPACTPVLHASDCAVHNAPAMPVGPCNCGAAPGMVPLPAKASKEMMVAAVKFANGDAVYKNVAAGVLEIEEQIYGETWEAMVAAFSEAKP